MADNDEVEDYPFTNADEHLEEEEERAAKLIWVGAANSTKHKLKIKWSVSGARRKKSPKNLFKFGLGLSIPGIGKVDPTIEYERGETDLVLTGDSSSGAMDQAPYVYEKVRGNADTDENSKLVHLEFYKEGEPEFFWQTTVKKKHGVIIIEDPDDDSKLSVIPAVGQFKESNRWMPSKAIKHPKRKRTYDPSF